MWRPEIGKTAVCAVFPLRVCLYFKYKYLTKGYKIKYKINQYLLVSISWLHFLKSCRVVITAEHPASSWKNSHWKEIITTDRKGNVMSSQVFVCPQSASWILIYCSALLQRVRYASLFYDSMVNRHKNDCSVHILELNLFSWVFVLVVFILCNQC